MKLLIGLGNPGSQYARTRHNAGFMVIDRLIKCHGPDAIVRSRFNADCVEIVLGGQKCLLLKPMTFMNRSGQSVLQAVQFYKLDVSDMLVFTDDLALPVGSIRLRAKGSPGGHNGLADIQNRLATADYPRCRIGIGPKPSMYDQSDFVLSRFAEHECDALEASIKLAADAGECFVASGIDAAMNRFNTKLKAAGSTKSESDCTKDMPQSWPGPGGSEA